MYYEYQFIIKILNIYITWIFCLYQLQVYEASNMGQRRRFTTTTAP